MTGFFVEPACRRQPDREVPDVDECCVLAGVETEAAKRRHVAGRGGSPTSRPGRRGRRGRSVVPRGRSRPRTLRVGRHPSRSLVPDLPARPRPASRCSCAPNAGLSSPATPATQFRPDGSRRSRSCAVGVAWRRSRGRRRRSTGERCRRRRRVATRRVPGRAARLGDVTDWRQDPGERRSERGIEPPFVVEVAEPPSTGRPGGRTTSRDRSLRSAQRRWDRVVVDRTTDRVHRRHRCRSACRSPVS